MGIQIGNFMGNRISFDFDPFDPVVFSVSQENIYSRGPYFFIYIFAYFISILYLSLSTIFVSKQFQNRSKALIYLLMIFLIAETIIQILVQIFM